MVKSCLWQFKEIISQTNVLLAIVGEVTIGIVTISTVGKATNAGQLVPIVAGIAVGSKIIPAWALALI